MELIIYILVQLVNVISGTIKYVCTVKSGPLVAALVNAVNYSLNAVLTLLMVKQEMWIAIIVSFCCNMVGVPLGKWLVDKFKKDRLWIFTATIKFKEDAAAGFKKLLKEYDISSNYQEIVKNEMYMFYIYSKTTKDSNIIKAELAKLDAHYHRVEAV